jgi:hypothetical protein
MTVEAFHEYALSGSKILIQRVSLPFAPIDSDCNFNIFAVRKKQPRHI